MATTWKEVYPQYANDATANQWVAYRQAGCGAKIIGAFASRNEAIDALGEDEGDVNQFGEMLCDWGKNGCTHGPHNTAEEIEAYFAHLENEGATL